jgi:hypothetical protein
MIRHCKGACQFLLVRVTVKVDTDALLHIGLFFSWNNREVLQMLLGTLSIWFYSGSQSIIFRVNVSRLFFLLFDTIETRSEPCNTGPEESGSRPLSS